jgi:hypothetical protein
MNERIKELIEQCSEYSDMHQGIWFNKEKFAELIVKECASKVDWIYSEKGKTADGVEYTVTQGDLIREHFGVDK